MRNMVNHPTSRPSRMIGASVLFYLPVVREVTLWFGALDAGKETVEMLLQAGANVELYPGALDEMLQPGTVCSAVFGVSDRQLARTRMKPFYHYKTKYYI